MKLNTFERFITNSAVRGFMQKRVEAPRLKKFALKSGYPYCLEIGGGTGRGGELIIDVFGAEKVIVTDIDPAQAAKSRQRTSRLVAARPELKDRIDVKVEDAMALSFEDNSFDAVFAFGVIHHMEDWRKAIREIKRVLRPGGEFFFDELLAGFLTSFPTHMLTRHPEGGMFTKGDFLGYLMETGIPAAGYKSMDGIWITGNAVKNGRAQ
ncbi:MAG: class I SAM-dependent methyltransferase [Actinomycetota bacterium]|nr:class I SAM-dependent methyltransferase [Actinomycetota bacterium]